MSIPTRPLGRNGPQVSSVGFGLMSIGGVYGAAPSDEAQNLDKAKDIFLATKSAIQVHEDYGQNLDTSPEYARMALEKSLKGLQADSIDLYYAHRVDGKTPIEKTVEAMEQFKK
ncbi:NADP-dependent oxidoreductase domain-containing protein [Aspergillus spectabilis]